MPLSQSSEGARLILVTQETPQGFQEYKRAPVNREGCACGCISFYDENQTIPLIAPEGESVFEGEVVPLDQNGVRRNLEQEQVYFAIRDNHVALICSSFNGIKNFTNFFYWLFNDNSEVTDNAKIELVNTPSRGVLERLRNKKVRKISMKSDAYTTTLVPVENKASTDAASPKRASKLQKFTKTFKETPLLKALLGLIDTESVIDLSDDEALSRLSINVDFFYRNKKGEETAESILDIAKNCYNMEGTKTSIQLDKGSIKNDELTIKDTIEIQAPNGNLARLHAFSEIALWLTQQIENENIPLEDNETVDNE